MPWFFHRLCSHAMSLPIITTLFILLAAFDLITTTTALPNVIGTPDHGTASMVYLYLVGVLTWVAASRAWIQRPTSKTVQHSYLLSLGLMNVCALGITYPLPSSGLRAHLVPISQFATSAVLPSAFFHYFLIAPIPVPRVHRWHRRIIYIPSAIFLILWLWLHYHGVRYQRSFFLVLMPGYEIWNLAYFLLCSLGAQSALLFNCFKAPARPLRRQAKWLLIGVTTGLTPLTVLISAPAALGRETVGFNTMPAAYTLILIPVCYIVAIIRHRLMDLELIINRSAVYAIVSSFAIGTYLLGVFVLSSTFNHLLNIEVLAGVSALLVAILVAPVKARVSNWIDRAFYREEYDYREILRELSRSLSSILSLHELANTVLNAVDSAMHVREGFLLLRNGEGFRIQMPQTPLLAATLISFDDPWLRYLEHSQAPLRTRALPQEQLSEQMATLSNLCHPEVWVPFLLKDHLIAVLVLGPKLSEDAYTYQDLSLLGGLMHQGGIAIQNALLYEELRLRTEVLEKARDELMQVYTDTYGGALPASAEDNVITDFQAIAAALKQSYERLRELDALKTQFVANVTHELGTPLTHIKGYVDNLVQGVGGALNDKQQRYLYRITDNCDRLIRLINDLLDLSRIDSGRLVLNRQRVELTSFTEEVVFSVQATALAHQIELTAQCPDGDLTIYADPDKLRQILLNLLSNAVKFTDPGGHVILSIEEMSPSQIAIHVEDDGIGIPAAEQQRIFERFHQVPGTKTRGAHGTGLGLAIVSTLVELHEGHISVVSAPGKGSRFSVLLPRKEDENPWQTKDS